MLAYADNGRAVASLTASPRAMMVIIAGHALLLAAVMTAKMDVVVPGIEHVPTIFNVDPPTPPPPPPEPQPRPAPRNPRAEVIPQQPLIDHPPTILDMGLVNSAQVEIGDILQQGPPAGGVGGEAVVSHADPVRIAAVSRTPEEALRPPYPNSKLRDEEEATLKLRLSIDARGRVTAVTPVGPADPTFLEAARRHIIRAWRYRPATEDGVAVSSTMVISLSFRLEDA
ncbi:MAG: TonB family protein [Sphingomonas sp.]|nr:TonB family protein [Sphingomonas sp.]